MPVELAIIRLAPDRSVLDAPWGAQCSSIAHVWPDARVPEGWMRVAWPLDARTGRRVAPVDLHIGHVLEVGAWAGGRWHAVYAWIADADERRFVLVPGASASDAVTMADDAADMWREAELGAVEDAWRQRMEGAVRHRHRAS